MGKGDQYRPVDRRKYEEGYERAFGKRCPYCKNGMHPHDWDPLTKKWLQCKCLICGGTGRVYPKS